MVKNSAFTKFWNKVWIFAHTGDSSYCNNAVKRKVIQIGKELKLFFVAGGMIVHMEK